MKKHLASLAIGMALGIGGLLVLGAGGEPAAVPMPGPAGWDRLKWVAYPNGVTGIFDPASGKLEERKIKAGLANWEYTEILDGLAAGDRIVTSLEKEGVKAGATVTPDDKAKVR